MNQPILQSTGSYKLHISMCEGEDHASISDHCSTQLRHQWYEEWEEAGLVLIQLDRLDKQTVDLTQQFS